MRSILNGRRFKRNWQKRGKKRHQLRSLKVIKLRYDYFNLLFKHSINRSFIVALTSFKFAVEANVSCIHITTTGKRFNFIVFHSSDNIIVTLKPVFTSSMNPSNIMTSVRRPAFMSYNSNKLKIARVKALPMLPVQSLVFFL